MGERGREEGRKQEGRAAMGFSRVGEAATATATATPPDPAQGRDMDMAGTRPEGLDAG